MTGKHLIRKRLFDNGWEAEAYSTSESSLEITAVLKDEASGERVAEVCYNPRFTIDVEIVRARGVEEEFTLAGQDVYRLIDDLEKLTEIGSLFYDARSIQHWFSTIARPKSVFHRECETVSIDTGELSISFDPIWLPIEQGRLSNKSFWDLNRAEIVESLMAQVEKETEALSCFFASKQDEAKS